MKTLKFTSMVIGCFLLLAANANDFNGHGSIIKNYTASWISVVDGKHYEVAKTQISADWVTTDANGNITKIDEEKVLKVMNLPAEISVNGKKAEDGYFIITVDIKESIFESFPAEMNPLRDNGSLWYDAKPLMATPENILNMQDTTKPINPRTYTKMFAAMACYEFLNERLRKQWTITTKKCNDPTNKKRICTAVYTTTGAVFNIACDSEF